MIMRRFFILSLAAFFLLTACSNIKKPSNENFTKAINRYLARPGPGLELTNKRWEVSEQ
jgi:outer membrane biogenesis lipoprotein LolB